MQRQHIAIATAVALIIVLVAAHRRGLLDAHLPAGMRRAAIAARLRRSHFVGAYGRTPEMQGCLQATGPGLKATFNRCTYA